MRSSPPTRPTWKDGRSCHAPQGAPCRHTDGTPRTEYGRPMICPDRRRAWQMLRDGEIRRQED